MPGKKKHISSNSDQESVLKRYSDSVIGAVALLAFFLLILEQTEFIRPWMTILKRVNAIILLLFLIDTLYRFLLDSDKIKYLKGHWVDFIVLIPLIQYVNGIRNYESYVIIRQFVIIAVLISRTRKTKKFITSLGLKPAQLMVISFFFTICAGAVVLTLPAATVPGETTSLLDAFFTSASAVCVTGLIVHDTATHFSLFGQTVILLLIQLGGLGIMTFSVFLVILTGKQVGIEHRIVLRDVLDRNELSGAVRTISFIVIMTLVIELIGAVILSFMWYGRFGSIKTSAYHALFHSVSAFCNAGFSTFSDSLMGFASDTGTNVVISLLIIFGGLGFMVVRDIFDRFKARLPGAKNLRPRMRIQTMIVLYVTVLLIIIGSLGIFAFETGYSASGMNHQISVLQAFFQSVSARTAGFNSCDIGLLSPTALFFIIILMFIGASPGSTGGGLKTTTFAVLWGVMMNGFSQNKNVEILKRTIPDETIQKATTLLLFYLVIISVFVIALLGIERLPLIDILFESVSAVATVGLSTGITAGLSEAGKTLIIALMFFGRLGPLTIGYALILYQRNANYEYAEERVMIG